MKRIIIVILVLLGRNFALFAQKPVLDTNALQSWPSITDDAEISDNGNYVLYPTYTHGAQELRIWSKLTGKTTRVRNAIWGCFSHSSKNIVYYKIKDSLEKLDLKRKKSTFIAQNVLEIKFSSKELDRWLAWQTAAGSVVLYDNLNDETRIFKDVENFTFAGKGIVLQGKTFTGQSCLLMLRLGDERSPDTIYKGDPIIHYSIDISGRSVSILTKDKIGRNTLWYAKNGSVAQLLANEQTPGIGPGKEIADDAEEFNSDGNKIFFSIKQSNQDTTREKNAVSVDIWNYQNEYMPPEQMNRKNFLTLSHRAVINLASHMIFLLDTGNEEFLRLNHTGDSECLVGTRRGPDAYRESDERPSIYLVNTTAGIRTLLVKNCDWTSIDFSPNGGFVSWYDSFRKGWYLYNLKTKITRNISKNIPYPVYVEETVPRAGTFPYSAPVWMDHCKGILLCDRYDIWKLDPTGRQSPINLTMGYGRKDSIVFRDIHFISRLNIHSEDDRVVHTFICAFDLKTKNNGFFEMNLTGKTPPAKMTLSPDFYYFSSDYETNPDIIDFTNWIKKASGSDAFLFLRQNSDKFPNLVFTRNFKKIIPLTDIQPQQAYNWYKTKLMRWKTFDGRPGEGILYIPENFDPSKKYPVIFYFYEQLSAGLYTFKNPDLSAGRLNIPWMVSHEYLVFTPDIHYQPGQVGADVYNYVVSGAEMLKKESFVDGTHLGIQGHSYGGYEVNYLVTHTGIFAAAMEASGSSDLVSAAGDYSTPQWLWEGHRAMELGQERMNLSLWEDKKSYIDNSPVFNADKVTTPLLIMHNKDDGNVPWSQGVEMFTSLRREHKKVWMLQYDGEIHINVTEANRLDLTTRMQQFFDHYLKGAPPPLWMTVGVPNWQKGYKSGLELDTSGRQP